jgi:hypothetical protein
MCNASRGLTGRSYCLRCGQSHWPHPTAVPAQGIVLQHSAGENCAGRRLLCVSMWFDNRTVTNFCLHASIVPVGPSGGPLFDRPKRGRKKPHQPARAHCVRVAGLDALRLTALLCAGATNRLPDSRCGAEGHTLAVPLCDAEPSETPHRERPGNRKQKKGKQVAPSFSVLPRKGSRSGEDLNPRLRLSQGSRVMAT